MMKDFFESLELARQSVSVLKECEIISLEEACLRVLGEDICARKNVPSFDNSALDGYAFKFDDKNEPLSVVKTIFAGDKNEYKLGKNECFKIMTGAKMPANADSVVMLEEAHFENERLCVPPDLKAFNAVRKKGEDIKAKEPLLKAFKSLHAGSVAVLASQGIYKLKVLRKLRVGVFSSGNELKEVWQNADESEIYNVNALAIRALLQNLPCEVSYLGLLKDEKSEVLKALKETQNYDLILTSAGASAGEADFMKEILNELHFECVFDKMKAKFAKPAKLFKKNDAQLERLVLCLPGNPLSAILVCAVFARALILAKCGLKNELNFTQAKLAQDLTLKSGRNDLIIGRLEKGLFYPMQNTSSGALKLLLNHHFLFVSDINAEKICKGESINLIKFIEN